MADYKRGDIIKRRLTKELWHIAEWPSYDHIVLHRLGDGTRMPRVVDIDVLYEHYQPLPEEERFLWRFLNE